MAGAARLKAPMVSARTATRAVFVVLVMMSLLGAELVLVFQRMTHLEPRGLNRSGVAYSFFVHGFGAAEENKKAPVSRSPLHAIGDRQVRLGMVCEQSISMPSAVTLNIT